MTPTDKKDLWDAISHCLATRFNTCLHSETRKAVEDIVDRIATPVIPDASVVSVTNTRVSDGKPQFSIVVGGPEATTPMTVPSIPPKAFVLFLWNGAAYDMSLYLRNDGD